MGTLPTQETLTVEFKSDRKRLPDGDLVDAVVGMANAEGVPFTWAWKRTERHPDYMPITSI